MNEMRPPDFIIGSPENPYLLRWFIWPRNPRLNLYLHKFVRDDEDRALHDHPWWFISLVLKGSYSEIITDGEIQRHRFGIAFRRAIHRHRVVLDRSTAGVLIPCWTLVLTGPRVRTWGFWCSKGFVPWQEFTKSGSPGEIGPGCGD